jgi:hypothetical protein
MAEWWQRLSARFKLGDCSNRTNRRLKRLRSIVDQRGASLRDEAAHLKAVMGLSEERACSIVGADRTMVCYRSRRPPDIELWARLCELANERQQPSGNLQPLTRPASMAPQKDRPAGTWFFK